VASLTVGFIFQFYNLIPVLTAFENVELPLLLTPLSRSERKAHVEMALRVVGLADRMDHYPSQLSGGQEQRVAIARAIVTDPTILVADEPTGDLDRKSAEEIMDLMDRLNGESKKTIIMVTHDPRAAKKHTSSGTSTRVSSPMQIIKILFKNAFRHKLRTGLTILSITIALLAFGLLRTVINAWYSGWRRRALTVSSHAMPSPSSSPCPCPTRTDTTG
jgi:ABC-type taurine transport system ATPase subunit